MGIGLSRVSLGPKAFFHGLTKTKGLLQYFSMS